MEKQCSCCNRYKPLSSFYTDKRYKYGVVGICKECQKIKWKKHRIEHYDEIREREKKNYIRNRESALKSMREYNKANWDSILKRKKEYNRKRRREDAIYREKMSLRNKVRIVFNSKGNVKSPSLEKIVGCSCNDLYNHLTSTWVKRYGKSLNGDCCQIDHIKPLCSAKTIEEVHKSFHYSNLQLLTPDDNREKGSFLV